jgi:amidase
MSYDYEQATRHRVAPASTPELVHLVPTPSPAPTPTATPAPAPATPAPAADGSNSLAATGAGQSAPLGLAGLALVAGGLLVGLVTVLKRRRPRAE